LDFNSCSDKAAVPGVNRNHLHELAVLIPPLPEQRAIAHVLGSLDDKIELNRKMNATLEAMAQTLFKSWFVDFDPVIDNALAAGNPIPEDLQARAAARESLGYARKPLPEDLQKLFPDSFQLTEELGWIPRGWEAKSVSSALSINTTEKLKKGTIATHADMKALPTEGFSVDEVVSKPYKGGSKFRNGDVLLARITPCLENGKTAVVDFLVGDDVGFGSTEFIVLRGKQAITTPFVACLSRLKQFREHCIASMIGSSGRQRVQNACFDNYYLALPLDPRLLSAYDALTQPQFQRITHNVQLNRDLAKTRDTLLPKLLSGELRLPLDC
jgi:type I restriction enzyme S subunit